MSDPFRTDADEAPPRRPRLFYCPKCGSSDNQLLLRPTEEELYARDDWHRRRFGHEGCAMLFEWFDITCDRCGCLFAESMAGHAMAHGGIHINMATVHEKERIEGKSAS
jgi:hypothetical protein